MKSKRDNTERDDKLRFDIENWMDVVRTDTYQALRMLNWVHQPKAGPICAEINRIKRLPEDEQHQLLKNHGFMTTRRPAA